MSEEKKLKHHYTFHCPWWRRSGAGFTLIELLIVAAIFSTTALIATTVFTNVQSRQRQIQGKQRVSADGRYVVETIARSIRTGSLNYAMFPKSVLTSNPTPIISTVDEVGVVTCYQLSGQAVQVATNAPLDCANPPPTWTTFTPVDLLVTDLKFYWSPVSDPFRPIPRAISDCYNNNYDGLQGVCTCTSLGIDNLYCYSGQTCMTTGGTKTCTNPNIQPHVTIYLNSKSTNTNPGEQSSTVIQTTVTSRVYQ